MLSRSVRRFIARKDVFLAEVCTIAMKVRYEIA